MLRTSAGVANAAPASSAGSATMDVTRVRPMRARASGRREVIYGGGDRRSLDPRVRKRGSAVRCVRPLKVGPVVEDDNRPKA
jgi:hypothetical protein